MRRFSIGMDEEQARTPNNNSKSMGGDSDSNKLSKYDNNNAPRKNFFSVITKSMMVLILFIFDFLVYQHLNILGTIFDFLNVYDRNFNGIYFIQNIHIISNAFWNQGNSGNFLIFQNSTFSAVFSNITVLDNIISNLC